MACWDTRYTHTDRTTLCLCLTVSSCLSLFLNLSVSLLVSLSHCLSLPLMFSCLYFLILPFQTLLKPITIFLHYIYMLIHFIRAGE